MQLVRLISDTGADSILASPHCVSAAICLRQDIFLLQPETIGALPSLEELWLDVNELSDLPPVSLEELWLDVNDLSDLPPVSLQELWLDVNELPSISLRLGVNELSELPTINLQELWLAQMSSQFSDPPSCRRI